MSWGNSFFPRATWKGRCRLWHLVFAFSFAVSVWPAPAGAQIFGKGARTEFITGFGVRTFASFLEVRSLLVDSEEVEDPLARQVHVRVTPVSVVYGLRPGISLVGIFPFIDKEQDFNGPEGRASTGGDAGLGDAVFLAKWRFFKRDRGMGTFQVAAEGGVKAPTGNNDLRDPQGGLLPPPLQRGSGSWDPTADLLFTYVPAAASARWVFSGDVGFTVTTEADDFQFGDLASYDGMVKYRVHPARYPGHDTYLLLEVNGRWQGRAQAGGRQVPDSGGHVVFLSPGIQFLLKQNLIVEGGVQLPVVRDLNGMQLGPDFRVLVGLRYIIVP